jgi:hypothetical protein
MLTRINPMLLIVSLLLASCGHASATPKPADTAIPSGTSAGAVPALSDQNTPTVNGSAATKSNVPLTYPIVDTGQGKCYDNNAEMACPADGAYFGQDSQYTGLIPAYEKHDDGTVTDKNTGLTWQYSLDADGNGKINAADKLTFEAAGTYCQDLNLAGAADWRLPDIKTLYSLVDFRGTDPSGATGIVDLIPFIDNAYFNFAYGDTAAGERIIDSQFASSTRYVDTSTNDGGKVFGVNFADGRIKGYGLKLPGGGEQKFFVLCVRGSSSFGANQFVDNGDDTISDQASGLVWQKADSGKGMDWQAALAYCEGLSLAGADDWRLPDAKSLQSLVDYNRSPSTSNSAALDPLFSATSIKNEAGQSDYPYYWSSTTHVDWEEKGPEGVYLAFGRALGYMGKTWVDVHGAGAQRSDPKSGNPADFPKGRGPQGDSIRILNYARCVRAGNVTATPAGNPNNKRPASPVDVTEPLPVPTLGAPDGGGGGGTPSPESIAACTGKVVGDACHYDTLIGVINGTCQNFFIPQMIDVLFCMPSLP